MKQSGRGRLNAQGGRALVERFERSGLSVRAFCAREAISAASLYRWRSIVGGKAAQAPAPRGAGVDTRRAAAGFIELGALAGEARVELKLELGAGVLLHLVRG
jgi:hypothetical protein